MTKSVSVTRCQYEQCGKTFTSKRSTQRYCSKWCSYRQRLIREKERRLVPADNRKYKRAPRSLSYRKKLIEWQKKKRIETTRLFRSWESFSLRANTSLKVLLRLFDMELTEAELRAVDPDWLCSEFKKQRNVLVKLFHPTKTFWRTRQISSRRPDRRKARLEAVCGKIQAAYLKSKTVIENRKKPNIFGRKK